MKHSWLSRENKIQNHTPLCGFQTESLDIPHDPFLIHGVIQLRRVGVRKAFEVEPQNPVCVRCTLPRYLSFLGENQMVRSWWINSELALHSSNFIPQSPALLAVENSVTLEMER